MSGSELLNYLKDIVVTAAALTGAIVAVKGLNTWKRQIKGQTEYALAKETLINIFKMRDEIINVRNPFMTSTEQPEPPEHNIQNMSHDQIRFYGLSEAYQNRWGKVTSLKSLVLVNLTEAEAVWGKDLKVITEDFFRKERELYVNIIYYLRVMNPNIDENGKKHYRSQLLKINEIIYSTSDDNDSFNKDLNDRVIPIEKYLRLKMGA